MKSRRGFLLAFIAAALAVSIVAPSPATAKPSFYLSLRLDSIRGLSDSAFASLVHWARSGKREPAVGDPAFSVAFELTRKASLAEEPDAQAVLTFLRGGGRSALYARGATDAEIGSRNPVNVPPPTPKPSATPNPYRALEFGSPAIGGPPEGGIVVQSGWAAVKRDGRGARACISFKNTDTRTATRILFQFPISDDAGVALATLDLDRRGTFSPGIDIRGWNDLASWQGNSNRGYDENCTSIDASMAALPLLAARFATYGIARVEYADGTSWTPPPAMSPQHP